MITSILSLYDLFFIIFIFFQKMINDDEQSKNMKYLFVFSFKELSNKELKKNDLKGKWNITGYFLTSSGVFSPINVNFLNSGHVFCFCFTFYFFIFSFLFFYSFILFTFLKLLFYSILCYKILLLFNCNIPNHFEKSFRRLSLILKHQFWSGSSFVISE